jgi:hypothetical protein
MKTRKDIDYSRAFAVARQGRMEIITFFLQQGIEIIILSL